MPFLKNNQNRHHKIFDYHEKKLENPFYSRKKKINHFSGLKNKMFILLGFMIASSLIWFIFASSFWKIKEIAINGLDRMPNNEISQMIDQQIGGRSWLIIPQKNLLFFNEKKFLSSVRERYRFQDIQLKKQWPSKLTIDIKEKTLACIWNESDKYYLTDTEGYILSEVNPLDITDKTHPLISNESVLKINDGKIQIDASYIGSIADLYDKVAKKAAADIFIDRFIVDKDIDTVKILTTEGVRISFNTKEDFNRQIEKLLVVKKEKLKDDFKNKKYIDLRFGDKVYFQ